MRPFELHAVYRRYFFSYFRRQHDFRRFRGLYVWRQRPGDWHLSNGSEESRRINHIEKPLELEGEGDSSVSYLDATISIRRNCLHCTSTSIVTMAMYETAEQLGRVRRVKVGQEKG